MEEGALALHLGMLGRCPASASHRWSSRHGRSQGTRSAHSHCKLAAPVAKHLPLSDIECRRDRVRGPMEAGASGKRLPLDASASPPEGIRGIAIAVGGQEPVLSVLVPSLVPVAEAQHASTHWQHQRSLGCPL